MIRRLVVLLLSLAICGTVAAREPAPRTIVLGVDGLDPKLLQQFMDEGVLPNFSKLVAQGDFTPLETSMPPLSPIAWSTFITGMDPGGHGIYDFIHRDPETLAPFLSMSKTEAAEREVAVGSYVFPLSGGKVLNLRDGKAFWEYLSDKKIPATVFRMPVNFPPVEAKGTEGLSGMGTPDIRGTPGTFSFYTDRSIPDADEISGGKVYPVSVKDGRVSAALRGPKNSFRRFAKKSRNVRSGGDDRAIEYDNPELRADFDVWVDPERDAVRIDVQGRQIVLEEGEWSSWFRVDFTALPLIASVNAIGRFYLKQVRPDFELYVTPLQINPEEPALPISSPESWARELFDELGYFYTQELPEDTKALQEGIFTGREFWTQAQHVYKERRRALDYFLDNFDEGLLFFYFSSVDQQSHMLWRYIDEEHPGFQDDEFLLDGIRKIYRELDEALGRTMKVVDDETTLIVMSDHGFSPFYWGVNLNTWLLEKGYAKLRDPSIQGRYPMFVNTDWAGTRAYAMGLNGLYVNLKGREKRGIVDPEDYDAVLDELERDLLAMVDPRTGKNAVTLVVRPRRDFKGPWADKGPDILVGYAYGYRSSWKSPLGEFPKEIFVDNANPWSGDHSIDYREVPGTLISNREITMELPALYDLTVAILDEYGIAKPDEMIGQDCLGERLRGGNEDAKGGD